MKAEFLERLVSISLRARLLRAHYDATKLDSGEAPFSEREILTMEALHELKNITEKSLCQLFGLSPSSVSDLVSRLVELKLLTKPEKTRGKPLSLTKTGQQQLQKLRQTSAQRFEYLFEGFSDKDWEIYLPMVEKVGENAQRYLKKELFRQNAVF